MEEDAQLRHLSLQEAAMNLAAESLLEYQQSGAPAVRSGNRSRYAAPPKTTPDLAAK